MIPQATNASSSSAHCDDPEWIDRYQPKTLERQRELQEERFDNATRRNNRGR